MSNSYQPYPWTVTPALGAGATPCGSSPAGSGTPAQATPGPPPTYLPDNLTGQSDTGRYINPTNGQYALDANGNFIGMGTMEQIVQIAISDIDFSSQIDTNGPDTPNQMVAILTTALAPYINQKLIQIVRVNAAELGDDGEGATLVWRDLTVQQERSTPIGGG